MVCNTPVITGKLDEVQKLDDKKNESPENSQKRNVQKQKSLLLGLNKPENDEEAKANPKNEKKARNVA